MRECVCESERERVCVCVSERMKVREVYKNLFCSIAFFFPSHVCVRLFFTAFTAIFNLPLKIWIIFVSTIGFLVIENSIFSINFATTRTTVAVVVAAAAAVVACVGYGVDAGEAHGREDKSAGSKRNLRVTY